MDEKESKNELEEKFKVELQKAEEKLENLSELSLSTNTNTKFVPDNYEEICDRALELLDIDYIKTMNAPEIIDKIAPKLLEEKAESKDIEESKKEKNVEEKSESDEEEGFGYAPLQDFRDEDDLDDDGEFGEFQEAVLPGADTTSGVEINLKAVGTIDDTTLLQNTPFTKEQVSKIQTQMKTINLPQPDWATKIPETEWLAKLFAKANIKENPQNIDTKP